MCEGYAVVHLVEALQYNLEGCVFGHLWPHCRPRVDSVSNRNEYQGISWGKGSLCEGLTALPPSYANCLEILGASTSRSPKDLSSPVKG